MREAGAAGEGGWVRVDEGLGDNAVWTISPRMKDDTPRWEEVPSRGAWSISVCRRHLPPARWGRRAAAARECRSGIGVLIRLRLEMPHAAAALLFHAARDFARAHVRETCADRKAALRARPPRHARRRAPTGRRT